MIREQTLFTVACDVCVDPLGFAIEGYTFHFDSLDEAYEEVTAAGWIHDEDRVICRSCVGRAVCAREGHAWEQWESVHGTNGYQGRRRYCGRCPDGTEFDPPLMRVVELPSLDEGAV